MMSKAWSCSSLQHGLECVDQHYQNILNSGMTEEDMQRELEACAIRTKM